ncbi:hypothetical protein [Sandaracinus amylolyticus]|uniref:Uncharacterized protein n=1 Tax=Sandaracinus amylolyticus TaxID=927083 RepID=A0A0F6YGD3_9BACT|nr:hypothetical protein [Sandaracinus amylolyticus]AKF04563.1 hypothetical protein DB32_001712 [Sandaracinus amylolyticus]
MHDVTSSTRRTILLLSLALAITPGCAAEVVPAGVTEADLDFAAPTPDLPDTEIPECWWVPEDQPELCGVEPNCVPRQPAPRTPPRRVASSTTPPITITTTTTPTTPRSSSPFGGPTDLAAPPVCPPTDGIVACPQCLQRDTLDPRVLTFDIPQLSPYVLLSNGASSWQVKDMLIPRSGDLGEVTVDLDLAAVVDQSGSVDLDEPLYVFVSREYETGPYPFWSWFYCPAGGGECVVLPSE